MGSNGLSSFVGGPGSPPMRQLGWTELHGTVSNPRCSAAATRPWPARIMFARSPARGAVKPNRRMDSAICRTCFFECVLAFLGYEPEPLACDDRRVARLVRRRKRDEPRAQDGGAVGPPACGQPGSRDCEHGGRLAAAEF